jgi:NitT/TauT family transport system substrate-binding protein
MKIRVALTPLLIAAVALSAAACGADSSQAGATSASASGSAGGEGLAQVDLAALSIAQVAPFVLADEKGIFEKNGIDLTITYVEPPALVPAVMSGDADFIWGNPPALLAARANNVPLKSVTTVSVAGEDPATFPIQVMVPTGSDIKSLADLAGKTVATASLFQLNDLALMESLNKAGVDASTVKFVEIPFPNMAEALSAGRADAIISTEPFVTLTKNSGGATSLVSVSEGLTPTTPISLLASSEQFIADNPDVVAKFRAAVDEASAYALAHDDEVRATIPKITELSPELAAAISLAPINTTDDPAAWDAWADLLVEVGAIKEKPESADAFLAD